MRSQCLSPDLPSTTYAISSRQFTVTVNSVQYSAWLKYNACPEYNTCAIEVQWVDCVKVLRIARGLLQQFAVSRAVCSCSDAKRKYRKAALQVPLRGTLQLAAFQNTSTLQHLFACGPLRLKIEVKWLKWHIGAISCNFCCQVATMGKAGEEREYTLRYYSCAHWRKLKLGHCVQTLLHSDKFRNKYCILHWSWFHITLITLITSINQSINQCTMQPSPLKSVN